MGLFDKIKQGIEGAAVKGMYTVNVQRLIKEGDSLFSLKRYREASNKFKQAADLAHKNDDICVYYFQSALSLKMLALHFKKYKKITIAKEKSKKAYEKAKLAKQYAKNDVVRSNVQKLLNSLDDDKFLGMKDSSESYNERYQQFLEKGNSFYNQNRWNQASRKYKKASDLAHENDDMCAYYYMYACSLKALALEVFKHRKVKQAKEKGEKAYEQAQLAMKYAESDGWRSNVQDLINSLEDGKFLKTEYSNTTVS